ncbi:MAG: GTPase HflX, partial [Proteobacteria bacterium]|nr:GTPase HflX [Pseudomonadota bacterium]
MLHPHIKGARHETRTPEACLAEARGLAEAIDLQIVEAEIYPIRAPRSATLFGPGQVAGIADLVKARAIAVVVVNGTLTPVQQRNLELAWNCKVIDRTGLILEIFGARARTREGRSQVELAALSYQRSRLVRSWTHLERQRGGHGFFGGPGETQIETDRRQIDQR